MESGQEDIKNKKFEDILLDEIKKLISKAREKTLSQRFKNFLFGENSPDFTSSSPLTEREKFVVEIFRGYYEIFISLENMKMIAIFVKQYPNYKSYKIHDITKTKYLRYYIENYLNEVYIFEKRIESFLNKLIKRLKRKSLNNEIEKIKKLKSMLQKTLEKIRKIRGFYVHKNRYFDKELEQLDLLEFFTSYGGLKELEDSKKLKYKQIRNYWFKIINKNNKTLETLLEQILESIKLIVFGKLTSSYKNEYEV